MRASKIIVLAIQFTVGFVIWNYNGVLFIYQPGILIGIAGGNSLFPVISHRDIIIFREFDVGDISRNQLILLEMSAKKVQSLKTSGIPISHTKLAKRIVGLPGDIYMHSNALLTIDTVDGKKFIYPSIKKIPDFCGQLKDAELFVYGDNYKSSIDSRVFGKIKLEDVKYTAVRRLFPHPEVIQKNGVPKCGPAPGT